MNRFETHESQSICLREPDVMVGSKTTKCVAPQGLAEPSGPVPTPMSVAGRAALLTVENQYIAQAFASGSKMFLWGL